MWWPVISLGILALLAAVLASSVRISIDYRRRGEDDRFAVAVSWLGIIEVNLAVPAVRLRLLFPGWQPAVQMKLHKPRAAEGERVAFPVFELAGRALRLLARYRDALVYAVRRVRVHELTWHTETGAGEADRTGLLSGVIWVVKVVLLTVATRYTRFLQPPSFRVRPNFLTVVTATEFRCTFDIRLGHVVIAGFKALLPPG